MSRVLVLGASGMLGNAMMRVLSEDRSQSVYGSTRTKDSKDCFDAALRPNLLHGIDVNEPNVLEALIAKLEPQVVINCVGVVKQLAEADDPLVAIPMNSILPHRLAKLCASVNARLVHFSTDCVFDGSRGNYGEDDRPDPSDLYGRTKLLGEVDYPNAVTLRTSIVGHELGGAHGLVDWFLSQRGSVRGFTRAIFSGLATVELARVVRDIVMSRADLHGVYHVASSPISKYDLLRLVSEVYGNKVDIVPDGRVVLDRSLNANRFREATAYEPPSWPDQIRSLHDFYGKR